MVPDLQTTQVIILSTFAMYREAWQVLLSQQPYIDVLGTAGQVEEVSELTLGDLRMTILVDLPTVRPDIARELRPNHDRHGLLFLLDEYQLDEIVNLLRAGATGCLSRGSSIADLSRALIAAGRGEIVLPPAMASRALAALAGGRQSTPDALDTLSERENDVLELLAQGKTNKDIAQNLFLSVRTVEAHLRSIYGKLAVSSRTEAALWAVRNGYSSSD